MSLRTREQKDSKSRFLAIDPPQLLKEMTSSAAFRRVQAWLLEKPALMAQRPPYERPRKLEAERSHQRHLIAQLDRSSSIKLCAARSGSATTKISAECWTARTSSLRPAPGPHQRGMSVFFSDTP